MKRLFKSVVGLVLILMGAVVLIRLAGMVNVHQMNHDANMRVA